MAVDIVAPTVVVLGNAPEIIRLGDVYVDEGATANDAVDGNLTAQIATENPVDASIIGDYTVRYSVTDAAGNTGLASRLVSVVDPADFPDITPPVASLDNLTEGQTVTSIMDVLATIQDESAVSWTIAYRATDAADFQSMATGVTEVVSSAVTSFDPTLLMNGQYELLLTAVDEGGLISEDRATVVVDGDMKVGNFSITYEDLSIPMSGLPIIVNRTYDSRQRGELHDFGYGWTIDYQDIEINETRAPGADWSLNQYGIGPLGLLPDFCVEANGDPRVTVTLPNGDVEAFTVKASPECNPIPVLEVSIGFEAVEGTTSTLRALEENFGRFNVSAGYISEITSEEPRNPNRYELTTKSGFIYTIDQEFGIETVVDPNGNTLTYSDGGITHSGGKSIDFVRDGEGRITEITDPKGNMISYNYDTQGDLVGVTDRVFATTSYSYNNSHGLLEIEDPLGRTPLRNIYSDAGRLIAQEDNAGNRTSFEHSIDGRQSTINNHRSLRACNDVLLR